MTVELRGGLEVTTEQASVVDSFERSPVTLVSAGAGTGKTHTALAAVLHMLETRYASQGAIRPSIDQFALITFTNKAADELAARLEGELKKRIKDASRPASERLYWQRQRERVAGAFLGTIHAYCSEILRAGGYAADIARGFDVSLASYPLKEAVKTALEEHLAASPAVNLLGKEFDWYEYDLRREIENILRYMQSHGLKPGEVLAKTKATARYDGKPHAVAMASIVARAEEVYNDEKVRRQSLDTADLLVQTAEILESAGGAGVRRSVARRWPFLLVDEFQDTDIVQKRVLDALKPGETDGLERLLVVGDPKQSIFRWKAADQSILANMARERGLSPLPLTISRRPTKKLLQIQNTLFRTMSAYGLNEELTPWTQALLPRDIVIPFTLVYLRNRTQMPGRIDLTAREIRRLLAHQIDNGKGGLQRVQPKDVVVIARTNSQVQAYVEGLRRNGINATADVGGAYFQTTEVIAVRKVLRFVVDPHNATLALAMETPFFAGVDPSNKLEEILAKGEKTTSLVEWFEAEYPEHATRIHELRTALKTDTVPQILAQLYERLPVGEPIMAHLRRRGDVQAALNLERLREHARDRTETEQAQTVGDFLEFLRLMALTEVQEEEMPDPVVLETGDIVRVMTIHRAKGLEFPFVVIPEAQRPLDPWYAPRFAIHKTGVLDVALPTSEDDADPVVTASSEFDAALEENRRLSRAEEMRLLYVAITRATRGVVITGAVDRRSSKPTTSWISEILKAESKMQGPLARFDMS